MCGIVGLFLKTERFQSQLGELTADMLHEMRDRGPDSAGFAIYNRGRADLTRITVLAEGRRPDWGETAADLETVLGAEVSVRPIRDHAVLETRGDGSRARQWFIDNAPEVEVLSYGSQMEIYKAVGDPDLVAINYDLRSRSGTHALAHTRMATESAVTTNGSHPFATGADTCLVHNGSLSNYNHLRSRLERQGELFQTENDSEVAAGYLAWRLREGDSIEEALERAPGGARRVLHVRDRNPMTASPSCGIPSPASRRSSPRPTTGWPCHRSTGQSPTCPIPATPPCGNRRRASSTPGPALREQNASDHHYRSG